MDYIHYALEAFIVLLYFIVIIKICMWVAGYVGKKLGIAKFLMYLWRKIIRK